jgi:predicted histone-like DNA-binding protein
MALKVKAKEQYQNIGKYAGKYRYVMMPELYTALTQDKVIKEAALRSGVSKGVMQACWDAAGEVIKAWATEGHSVALPGLGTMRFGLRAKSVASVNDVRASLITSRRIIFTPDVDLKDELKNTAVQITCYDRDGKEVKRVTSTDDGTVEDPEQENGSGNGENGGTQEGGNTNQGGSGSEGGSQNQGGNSGSQSGNSGSQSGNTGGNSGSQSGTEGDYRLVIYKYGNGTSTVTDDSEQEINSNDNVHSGSNVNISVVPVEGKEPIAKVNGNRITLTENEGTYIGSFQMPTKGTVLEILTEPDEWDYADQN